MKFKKFKILNSLLRKRNPINSRYKNIRLDKNEKIPFDDVNARIVTEGLLGANYISIIPGFDSADKSHAFLQAGDFIAKTQDAMILENLIGQLLFNAKK